MMGTQRGFTVIEVILFLAISAMLFLIAFAYTNGTINNTRFTDESDRLTSFLQNQFSSVKSIESQRDDSVTAKCQDSDTAKAPGASDSCMVLGKLLYFDKTSGTISTSTIVSDAVVSQATTSELEAIRALNPRVLTDSTTVVKVDTTYSLSSQMSFTDLQYLAATTNTFNSLIIVRSPESESVYMAVMDVASGDSPSAYNPSGIKDALLTSGNKVNKPVLICAKEDGLTNRRLAIEIPVGQSAGRIADSAPSQGEVLSGGMACVN